MVVVASSSSFPSPESLVLVGFGGGTGAGVWCEEEFCDDEVCDRANLNKLLSLDPKAILKRLWTESFLVEKPKMVFFFVGC
jgi:hypothetical protein